MAIHPCEKPALNLDSHTKTYYTLPQWFSSLLLRWGFVPSLFGPAKKQRDAKNWQDRQSFLRSLLRGIDENLSLIYCKKYPTE
jgi:hypothetical protein